MNDAVWILDRNLKVLRSNEDASNFEQSRLSSSSMNNCRKTVEAHEIVHQNGGDVNVDTKPNQGATFNIYLPRFTGSAPD